VCSQVWSKMIRPSSSTRCHPGEPRAASNEARSVNQAQATPSTVGASRPPRGPRRSKVPGSRYGARGRALHASARRAPRPSGASAHRGPPSRPASPATRSCTGAAPSIVVGRARGLTRAIIADGRPARSTPMVGRVRRGPRVHASPDRRVRSPAVTRCRPALSACNPAAVSEPGHAWARGRRRTEWPAAGWPPTGVGR
jgi:hypothetical protein